jgi:hypothetical protein
MKSGLTAGFVSLLLFGMASVGFSQGHRVSTTPTFSPAKFPALSFNELVTLSKDAPLPAALESRLSTVLNSPVVDNSFPSPTPTRFL